MTIYRGASFKLTILVKDPAGDPIDLTGGTALAEVRKRAAVSSTLILDLAPTITSPTAGEITINVPPATTATLEPQTAKWDLLVTLGTDTLVIVPTEDITIAPLATAGP